jgi:hypothetical protein
VVARQNPLPCKNVSKYCVANCCEGGYSCATRISKIPSLVLEEFTQVLMEEAISHHGFLMFGKQRPTSASDMNPGTKFCSYIFVFPSAKVMGQRMEDISGTSLRENIIA